jgi:Na+-driven multidrug efflux pump
MVRSMFIISIVLIVQNVQLSSSYSSLSISRIRPKLLPRQRIQSNFKLLSTTLSSDAPTSEEAISTQVVPTILDLVKFGLPTLGIWLLQPILSLIDTSVIGLGSAGASSVLELAALGPGIAWIDSTSYLCQFMGMATTNLFATAIAENDVPKQKKVLSHATIIATGLGFLLFAVQYIFAKPLVTVLAGSAVESIPYALAYSRIRSFASIIAVPTIVGQAAFLASKDSVTPLKAVVVGAIINIVGDLLLVCVFGKGIVGAAWATMLSQVGSALYLLYASVKKNSKNITIDNSQKLEKINSIENVNLRSDEDNEKRKSEIRYDVKTVKESSLKDLIYVPGFKEVAQYLSFCGPLFFVLLVKAFSWSYTTYACSPAGPVSLATHQIYLNMFCIFAIFGDAVSQISQTYLPPFLGSKNITNGLFEDGKKIISKLLKMAFFLGLFNSVFAFVAVSKYGEKVSIDIYLSQFLNIMSPASISQMFHVERILEIATRYKYYDKCNDVCIENVLSIACIVVSNEIKKIYSYFRSSYITLVLLYSKIYIYCFRLKAVH